MTSAVNRAIFDEQPLERVRRSVLVSDMHPSHPVQAGNSDHYLIVASVCVASGQPTGRSSSLSRDSQPEALFGSASPRTWVMSYVPEGWPWPHKAALSAPLAKMRRSLAR